MDARDQMIATLFDMRTTAMADLQAASGRPRDPEWVADRVRDIQYATAKLVKMGEL